MAGQKCNAVQFQNLRVSREYVLKLPPARGKQTVYHLTHCTHATHALLNMLIILITIMMIAGCPPLATHTHTHTQIQVWCTVGEDKKQRSTGKERQGEILTAGNRRGANDNVEYDWGRFMEFLQKLSAWSDRFLLHPHSAMTDDFYSNSLLCHRDYSL